MLPTVARLTRSQSRAAQAALATAVATTTLAPTATAPVKRAPAPSRTRTAATATEEDAAPRASVKRKRTTIQSESKADKVVGAVVAVAPSTPAISIAGVVSLTPRAAGFVEAVQAQLRASGDATSAVAQKKYLRDQFEFYGISGPDRHRIPIQHMGLVRDWQVADVQAAVMSLYSDGHREAHYAAVELLAAAVKSSGRRFPSESKQNQAFDSTDIAMLQQDFLTGVVRHTIVTHSWWDTVDWIASHVVGRLVYSTPALVAVMDAWISDEHLWLRRTAILHQLKFGEAADQTRLFDYCLKTAHEDDFFIRKAIGWALRQHARTNGPAVKKFVQENADKLSPLSKKEAMKHL